MATEKRDDTITGGLVKRGANNVRTMFDIDATPGARRSAMLKTVAVGGAVAVSSAIGIEGLAHDPSLLNILSSPWAAPGEIVAAASLGLSGAFVGLYAVMDGGLPRSERTSFAKFFHGTRTVGYAAAGALGLAAAAYAGGGAEHLLPSAGDVSLVLGGIASGAAGLGAASHVLQRAIQPPQPRRPAALGE